MSDSGPEVERMSLAKILTFWRPGSYDWSWGEEYADIMARPETAAIRSRVRSEGFGFLDYHSPVLLGSDGRVWDGHHRICLAIEADEPWLMVERCRAVGDAPNSAA